MILFKDGLKFRGIYLHNLDNDQVNFLYIWLLKEVWFERSTYMVFI